MLYYHTHTNLKSASNFIPWLQRQYSLQLPVPTILEPQERVLTVGGHFISIQYEDISIPSPQPHTATMEGESCDIWLIIYKNIPV